MSEAETTSPRTDLRRPAMLGALLCGVVVFLACWWLLPHEPSYHGRRLSDWLGDLDSAVPAQREASAQAIRRLGSQAVPFLVHELKADNSRLKLMLIRWAPSQVLMHMSFLFEDLR